MSVNDDPSLTAARVPAPEAPDSGAEVSSEQPSGPRRGRQRWVLGGVALLVIVAVVYGITTVMTRETPFNVAIAQCALEDNPDVRLINDGSTLILDLRPNDTIAGLHAIEFACVLGELDIPSDVLVRMEAEHGPDTTSGAELDDMSIQWSHPVDSIVHVNLKR